MAYRGGANSKVQETLRYHDPYDAAAAMSAAGDRVTELSNKQNRYTYSYLDTN